MCSAISFIFYLLRPKNCLNGLQAWRNATTLYANQLMWEAHQKYFPCFFSTWGFLFFVHPWVFLAALLRCISYILRKCFEGIMGTLPVRLADISLRYCHDPLTVLIRMSMQACTYFFLDLAGYVTRIWSLNYNLNNNILASISWKSVASFPNRNIIPWISAEYPGTRSSVLQLKLTNYHLIIVYFLGLRYHVA